MNKKKLENIEAVIFDNDGTLFNTESLMCCATTWAYLQFGYELSEKEFVKRWIIEGTSSAGLIKDKGLDIDLDKLREKKFDKYKEFCKYYLIPMPGAMAAVDYFFGNKIPMAIASASSRRNVENALNMYKIIDRFKAVLTSRDVKRTKPAPDIYLKAAELLDVAPELCLVFEDTNRGLRAAKAAGMQCIVTPNIFISSHFKEDYSEADLVIPNLTYLDYSLFLPVILS